MAPAHFTNAPQRTIAWTIVAAWVVLALFLWPPLGHTVALLARIAWSYVLVGARG